MATDIHNALIFSGGHPPLAVPSATGVVSDVMMFEMLELYYIGNGGNIIIDLLGNAMKRLAEEYKREPVQ